MPRSKAIHSGLALMVSGLLAPAASADSKAAWACPRPAELLFVTLSGDPGSEVDTLGLLIMNQQTGISDVFAGSIDNGHAATGLATLTPLASQVGSAQVRWTETGDRSARLDMNACEPAEACVLGGR